MAKRKKKEDSPEEKQKQVMSKLFFLSLLATLVLLTHFLISFQREREADINTSSSRREEAVIQGEESAVLGEGDEAAELEKNITEQVEDLKVKAEETREEIETSSETFVKEKRSEIEGAAGDLLYRTAIKPLLDKFESMPSNQQDYIRGYVCEPASE